MEEYRELCRHGPAEKLREFLDTHKDLSQAELDDGLYNAIKALSIPTMDILLGHGAQFNEIGTWAGVMRASSVPIFDCLVRHGWDVNDIQFGHPALR